MIFGKLSFVTHYLDTFSLVRSQHCYHRGPLVRNQKTVDESIYTRNALLWHRVFRSQDDYEYSVAPSDDTWADGFEMKRNKKGVWGLRFRRIPREPGRYRLAIDGRQTPAGDQREQRRDLPILHVKLIVSGNWTAAGLAAFFFNRLKILNALYRTREHDRVTPRDQPDYQRERTSRCCENRRRKEYLEKKI